MKITKKQRLQLIINISLMLLTLLTMVSCIFAWFFTQIEAEVTDLSMQVDRYFSGGTTRIIFPCATKITDEETTPEQFDSTCVVVRNYQIYGDGKVGVSVVCEGPGMLAYICDSVYDENYYELITAVLEEELGTDRSKWTFDKMTEVMNAHNNKTVGDLIGNDTYIKIVYWVEYDEAIPYLGTNDADGYWQSESGNINYVAKIDLYN